MTAHEGLSRTAAWMFPSRARAHRRGFFRLWLSESCLPMTLSCQLPNHSCVPTGESETPNTGEGTLHTVIKDSKVVF